MIQPKELATVLTTAKAPKPVLLHVGFPVLFRGKHIPNSIYAGPGGKPEGLENLKKAVAGLRRTKRSSSIAAAARGAAANMKPAMDTLKSLRLHQGQGADDRDQHVQRLDSVGLPVRSRLRRQLAHGLRAENVVQLREADVQIGVALRLPRSGHGPEGSHTAVSRVELLKHVHPLRNTAEGREASGVEFSVVLQVDEDLGAAGAFAGLRKGDGYLDILLLARRVIVDRRGVQHGSHLRVGCEPELHDETRTNTEELRLVKIAHIDEFQKRSAPMGAQSLWISNTNEPCDVSNRACQVSGIGPSLSAFVEAVFGLGDSGGLEAQPASNSAAARQRTGRMGAFFHARPLSAQRAARKNLNPELGSSGGRITRSEPLAP